MVWFDGHHELGAEQAAGPHEAFRPFSEVGERSVVVGTVMPRAARPDRVTDHVLNLGDPQEVTFDDPYAIMQFFALETVDEAGDRCHALAPGKADLSAVRCHGVTLDGDDVVAGGGQRDHELAVAGTGGTPASATPAARYWTRRRGCARRR